MKFILPWPLWIIFGAILVCMDGIMIAIGGHSKILEKDIHCTPKAWKGTGGGLHLLIDCQGEEDALYDGKILLVYKESAEKRSFLCDKVLNGGYEDCRLAP